MLQNLPYFWNTKTLEVVRIFLSDQIFNHKSFSNEDNHLAHIDLINFFLNHLADHQAADLFWCRPYYVGPLAEKQRRPDDRLDGLEKKLLNQYVPSIYLL